MKKRLIILFFVFLILISFVSAGVFDWFFKKDIQFNPEGGCYWPPGENNVKMAEHNQLMVWEGKEEPRILCYNGIWHVSEKRDNIDISQYKNDYGNNFDGYIVKYNGESVGEWLLDNGFWRKGNSCFWPPEGDEQKIETKHNNLIFINNYEDPRLLCYDGKWHATKNEWPYFEDVLVSKSFERYGGWRIVEDVIDDGVDWEKVWKNEDNQNKIVNIVNVLVEGNPCDGKIILKCVLDGQTNVVESWVSAKEGGPPIGGVEYSKFLGITEENGNYVYSFEYSVFDYSMSGRLRSVNEEYLLGCFLSGARPDNDLYLPPEEKVYPGTAIFYKRFYVNNKKCLVNTVGCSVDVDCEYGQTCYGGECVDFGGYPWPFDEGSSIDKLSVSNLVPKKYVVDYDGLNNGDKPYIDEAYYIEDIPSWLEGKTVILTTNTDKENIRFIVEEGCFVYLIWDQPNILEGWKIAGNPVLNSEILFGKEISYLSSFERILIGHSSLAGKSFSLIRKEFSAGEEVIIPRKDYDSNYIIFVLSYDEVAEIFEGEISSCGECGSVGICEKDICESCEEESCYFDYDKGFGLFGLNFFERRDCLSCSEKVVCETYVNEVDCLRDICNIKKCRWDGDEGCVSRVYQMDGNVVKEKDSDKLHLIYSDMDADYFGWRNRIRFFHEVTSGGEWIEKDNSMINKPTKDFGARYDSTFIILDDGTIVLTYYISSCNKIGEIPKAISKSVSFVSDDNGETWKGPFDIVSFKDSTGSCESYCEGNKLISDNTVEASADDQVIFQLRDGSILYMSLYNKNEQFPEQPIDGDETYFTKPKGVYSVRSYDGGINWGDEIIYGKELFDNNIHKNIPVIWSIAQNPVSGEVYAGASAFINYGDNADAAVFISADNGRTWNFNEPELIQSTSRNEEPVLFFYNDKLYSIVVGYDYSEKKAVITLYKRQGSSWEKISGFYLEVDNCGVKYPRPELTTECIDGVKVTNEYPPGHTPEEECGGINLHPIIFDNMDVEIFYGEWNEEGDYKVVSTDITDYLI